MRNPQFAPTTMPIHALSSRLSRLMFSHFGILTPEANASPILWRSVRCLGGTRAPSKFPPMFA